MKTMTEPDPSAHPDAPSRPPRRLADRVEFAAVALTIACGLIPWAVGGYTRGYNYDEVTRAHSIWLASTGLRPYGEFFECHPPYFALLTPVVRIFPDPTDALRALRLFASVGNLLFLGALGALGAWSVPEARRWGWLGLAVLCQSPILDYLVEFRIDSWGYALGTWSLYRYVRLPRGAYRAFELGGLTGIATVLFCPKLVLLPPLVVLFEQVVAWESPRVALREGMAYAAGVGVALGMVGLYLAWHGIDLDRMSQLLVRYHAISGANGSFRLGLLKKIYELRALHRIILAGLVGWVVFHVRRGSRPRAYESAVAVWLAMQALLVAYPHGQYFAPWFLFGSCFLFYLGQVVSDLLGRGRVVLFLALCVMTLHVSFRTAWIASHYDHAYEMNKSIRWMNRVTRPGDRVVATPPYHPIDRLDTFFVWFNTYDPKGFDSGRILASLPSFGGAVTPARTRQELETYPPALVVLAPDEGMTPYVRGQMLALDDFLPRRGYRVVHVGVVKYAIRPDRHEEALRSGLID